MRQHTFWHTRWDHLLVQMGKFNNEDILNVTMDELPVDMRSLVEQECEEFQQKCLLSFSKNKSQGVF